MTNDDLKQQHEDARDLLEALRKQRWIVLLFSAFNSAGLVFTLTLIWNAATWKSSVDEMMQNHAAQLMELREYTAQEVRLPLVAERRFATLESEVKQAGIERATIKSDTNDRLNRIESKLDALLQILAQQSTGKQRER